MLKLPREPWRGAAAVLISALLLRYLPWRLGGTLNLHTPQAAVLSVALLLAELMLLAHGLLQVWLNALGGSDGRAEIEAAAERLAALRLASPDQLPAVAVLVPTRGEPVELVTRALRGALALDYPRFEVWLLDDDARAELRDLSQRLGCRYLARAERRHAKAGNLNHALPHLDADLIAVFDADVVPLTTFLSRTVGLFADPSVGFVQTPQTYMDADPLMRNLRLEGWLMAEEEAFYRWIEPTRQRVGAVVCAGTSFVMALAALREVGGFETATTSEDLATGIRLVARGYRGLYVPEKLSAGLAPQSIGALVAQRCRWASGTLQTLRTGANPLTIPGLNPLQRLGYLEGISLWLLVFPFLILVAGPPLIGLAELAPLRVDPRGLLSHALPFYLSQIVLIRWLSHQSRSAFMPELYRWVLAYPLAKTVWLTLMGRPVAFHVTPKGGGIPPGGRVNASLLRPLLAVLAVQLLALGQVVRQLIGSWSGAVPLTGERSATLLVGLLWIGPIILLVLVGIRSCWDRPRREAIPWLAPRLDGWLLAEGPALPMRVEAISELGCELRLPAGSTAVNPIELRFDHPALREVPWPVRISAVRRERRGLRMGLRWHALSETQQELLQAYLYRRPGQWPTLPAPWDGLAFAVVSWRLLQRIAPEGWFQRSVLPIR